MAYWKIEAVARRCSVKNVFLEISQNSQENTCGNSIEKETEKRDSIAEACNSIQKETLAQVQVLSSKFCKISKNSFSWGTLLVAASGKSNLWPAFCLVSFKWICGIRAPGQQAVQKAWCMLLNNFFFQRGAHHTRVIFSKFVISPFGTVEWLVGCVQSRELGVRAPRLLRFILLGSLMTRYLWFRF